MAITRREFVRGLAVLSSGTAHSRALSVLHTSPAGAGDSAIVFENTIKASKIDFLLKNSVSPQRYSIETMTGGVAVFDYNNDGLLDIFFTNGAEIPSLKRAIPAFTTNSFAIMGTEPSRM